MCKKRRDRTGLGHELSQYTRTIHGSTVRRKGGNVKWYERKLLYKQKDRSDVRGTPFPAI